MEMVNAIYAEIVELLQEYIQEQIYRFGTLANNELREWRKKAHREFDKLWKNPTRIMTRYKAYSWLSNKMNLPGKDAHIALFEVEQCKKVIELSKKEMEE